MSEDLYCKVYVDGFLDDISLKSDLSKIMQGKIERRSIYAPPLVIDVFKNKDPDTKLGADNFCLWPCYLEIEPIEQEKTNGESFKSEIARLIKALSERGVRVVASCDFEDELKQLLK